MYNTTISLSILFALLIRWITSIHPYSGMGKPPMFGDYEAQRHWMEITMNLAPGKWYTNSTENDLLYWGLDYPPLTAYHSSLMGRIAHFINPAWVKLVESQGFESYHHKLFMRSTVFISDIIVFLSALSYYWIKLEGSEMGSKYLLRSMMIPSLIIIDHGHFQYNCITLGLFIWTIICLHRGSDLMATILFCLALNYKQISLYYALPIFFFLLKKCYNQKSFISIGFKFFTIAVTVLITFGILWIPYLTNIDSVLQVFRRIFPLNRGIYEDKVANFWYCLSVVMKIKNYFSDSQLATISGMATLIFSLPSCYMVFRQNTLKQLKYSLFVVSMAFFLFSFHVHEKTILFANTAMILLSDHYPFMSLWFTMISMFSLQPLLIKDQLMIPYFTLPIIYAVLCQNTSKHGNKLIDRMFSFSMLGIIVLSISALVVPPLNRYPHIHSLLNCLYSAGHFMGFYAFFLTEQIFSFQSKTPRDNIHMMTYIRPRVKKYD